MDELKVAFGMILLTFILLFVATFYTFKVALKDGPIQLVDKDYYQIGLNYEKTLEDRKKLEKQGYRFEILNQNLNLGKNELQVIYKKGDEFLPNQNLILVLEKGATDKYNQILDLEKGNNSYYTTLNISQSGKWILTLKSLNNNFAQSFTVQIP